MINTAFRLVRGSSGTPVRRQSPAEPPPHEPCNGRFATMGKDFAASPQGAASHQTRVHAHAPAGPELLGRTGTNTSNRPLLAEQGAVAL